MWLIGIGMITRRIVYQTQNCQAEVQTIVGKAWTAEEAMMDGAEIEWDIWITISEA